VGESFLRNQDEEENRVKKWRRSARRKGKREKGTKGDELVRKDLNKGGRKKEGSRTLFWFRQNNDKATANARESRPNPLENEQARGRKRAQGKE